MATSAVVKLLLDKTDFARKLDLTSRQVSAVDKRVKNFGRAAGKVGSSLTGMMGLGGLGAAGLSFGLVAGSIVRATKSMVELRTAMQQLQAYTGMARSTIEELGRSAVLMSSNSSKSAKEILSVFGAVSNSIPTLKQDLGALEYVSSSAMKLGAAGGLETEEAVRRLTGVLKVYGSGAEKAKEYTNALAAAARVGSGDVNYLTDAVLKVGDIASRTGLSFEELLGTLQSVSSKFQDPTQAGAQLNVVISKLIKAGGDLNPTVVGWNKAIENMGKRCRTTGDYMALLGPKAYRMGMALVESHANAKKLTHELSNTNAAFDAASAKADTVAVASAKLANKWDAFTNSLMKSDGWIKNTINSLGDLVDATRQAIEGLSEVKDEGRRGASSESLDVINNLKQQGVKTKSEALMQIDNGLKVALGKLNKLGVDYFTGNNVVFTIDKKRGIIRSSGYDAGAGSDVEEQKNILYAPHNIKEL